MTDILTPEQVAVCAHPEECCQALSRVWQALGITTYAEAGGKSVHELVAALRAERDALLRDREGWIERNKQSFAAAPIWEEEGWL